jgi:transposase InsO family protein
MTRHEQLEPVAGGAEAGTPGSAQPGTGRVGARRIYSAAEKRRILQECGPGKADVERAAAHLGLHVSTLYAWKRRLRSAAQAGSRAGPEAHATRGRTRPPFTPQERRAAVESLERSGLSVAEFARTWGVSAMTLYGWRLRYRRLGAKGLEGARRGRPKGSLQPIPPAVRAEIVSVGRRFPQFGLAKLRQWLVRFHGVQVSAGSVQKTLRAEGLERVAVRRKRRRSSEKPRSFERSRPGELWQTDITSFVLPRERRRVYLVVFLDDFSRYVVSFGLHLSMRSATVIEVLLEGIERFGKPREILTDQGPQYFTWRGKSAFQKLLLREGIRHVVARSHHPQTVGKCERLWETVSREFWERAHPQSLAEARERLAHFFAHYNHFRPHQGIGGSVPADRFFDAEAAVREALEKTLEKNELGLSLEAEPRQTAYLVAQLGKQSVSVVGERGKVRMYFPDGTWREVEADNLGMGSGGGIDEQETSDERASAERGGDAGGVERRAAAAQADGQEAGALQVRAEDAARGAHAVGERERAGAGAGAPDLHGAPGVLAGSDEQGGGGGALGRAAAAGLAALPAGGGGDGGGALEAAQAAPWPAAPDRSTGAGLEGAEEGERGSGAAPARGGGPGDAAAGAAGASGEEGGDLARHDARDRALSSEEKASETGVCDGESGR